MLTICLTCTKCGNVFEATTSEALPPGTRKKLGETFVCSRCAPTPYKTVPRRRYHCTTCAAAIWPNGYEEKTIGIGGGTCCVCEREKPGKELHLVSQEHPVVTVERQRAELETLRARVKELEANAGVGAMLTEVRTLANPEGVAKREVCEVSRTIGGTSYACTLTMGHDGHHRQDGEQGASWPNHAGSCDARCGYFELPRGCAVVDTQRLASLRAELTALGKHVEDVERRAYDTPTKAAFGDCLNKTLEVEQRIRLGEEMAKRIDQKLDTRANAISIDYYAMRARIDALEENRPSPKPDNLGMTYAERLALASAGKAETLEAVRSLTDALQALEGRLADVEASVGQPGPLDALENRVERLEGHIEHRAWTAITQRVEALEMNVDDLAAGWGSCGPARPDEKREAVIREHEAGYREAPLDLATLRVPGQATGVSETAVSFRPAGHALDIVTEVRVLPGYGSEERHEWVTVGPSEARLLARALTQWADEKEAKGAPSPQAYEPDSEDGS